MPLMSNLTSPQTVLKKPWRGIAQAIWLALVLLCIGMFLAGLPRLLHLLSEQTGTVSPAIGIDALNIIMGLEQAGISARQYAWFIITVIVAFALYCLATAFLIVRSKFDDWLVLWISLTYVAYGTGYFYVISPSAFTIWDDPFNLLARFLYFFCGVVLYVVFFYVFPDGRFVPRWMRWLAVLVIAWGVYLVSSFDDNLFLRAGSRFTVYAIVFTILIFASVIGAQVYRYRFFASPSQRQQTKWVVYGFSLALIVSVVINLPGMFLPGRIPPGLQTLGYVLATITFGALFACIGLLALTIAILRYRLWDIDRLIRRTLIYGLLSGLLAAIYLSSIILLQSLVQPLISRQEVSSGIIVISTLTIAALFKPLRDRVQGFIDRRFFQRKYNADKILENFSSIVRDEIELKTLMKSLIAAVDESLQPEHVSIWLKKSEQKGRSRLA